MLNCARSRLLLRKPVTRRSFSSVDAETPASFVGKVIVAVATPRFSLLALAGVSAISWFIGVRYGQNVEKRWRELETKDDAAIEPEQKVEQTLDADHEKLEPEDAHKQEQPIQFDSPQSGQRRHGRENTEALRAATSEEERAKLWAEIVKKKEEKWQQAHLEAERKRKAALEALRKI